MSSSCTYSKTITSLLKLQKLLLCKKCEELTKGLYSLGSCEHLFCKQCCDSLLGLECPVCSIPTHVKDATVNRQMSNIVDLCQELKRILLQDQKSTTSVKNTKKSETVSLQEELECTPQDASVSLFTTNDDLQIPLKESNTKKIPNIKPKNTRKANIKNGNQENSEVCNSLSTTTDEDSNLKNWQSAVQDSCEEKLPNFYDESNKEVAVSDKSKSKPNPKEVKTMANTRRGKSKMVDNVSIEQTTMTQFFQFGDDDNDDDDVEIEMDISVCEDVNNTNDVTSEKMNIRRRSRKSDSLSHVTPKSKATEVLSLSPPFETSGPKRRISGRTKTPQSGKTKTSQKSTPATIENAKSTKSSEASNESLITNSTPKSRRCKNTDESRANESLNESYSGKTKTPQSSKAKRSFTEALSESYGGKTKTPQSSNAKRSSTEALNESYCGKTKTPKSSKAKRSSTESLNESYGGKTKTPKSLRKKTMQTSTPSSSFSFNASFSGRSATKSQQVKKNAKGETPLHVAAIKGDYKKAVELLNNGASTNVRENAGWTPLHEAVNHGNVKIAQLLLDSGAMVNTPGLDNDTPLHDAINNNRLDCVRLLVSHGASLTLRNIHGLTARDVALTQPMKEALETPVNTKITTVTVQGEEENYQMLCFLGTGLSREDKIQLQKCASCLPARVVEDYCPEVTHIITSCNKDGMCPRTLKYLRGILAGKWIVNMDWVATCQEFGSRVSEEGFEVPGSSTNPESQAPYKGRVNRIQQLPGFFDGCQFYFHGVFEYPTPEKEDLMDLVRAGGGKILTREPKLQNIDEYPSTVPYHADLNSCFKDCSIFIIHDTNLAYPPIRSSRINSLPALWILESIGSFAFQNPK